MRRHRLSRFHLVLILLLTLLVFSATSTWGQGTLSATKAPSRVSRPAALVVSVPEAKPLPHPAGEKMLIFAPNPGQNPWRVSFTSRDIDYQHQHIADNALPDLQLLARREELGGDANLSIGNAQNGWPIDGLTDSRAPTLYPGGDLQFYGRHSPGAGGILLRFDELTQSHLRLAHLFELLDPDLCFGKRLPREQHKH